MILRLRNNLSLNLFMVVFTLMLTLLSGSVWGQSPQIFNSSGNWTVPCGVTSVSVQVWGGGGGGAGDGTNGGNSGSGGGGGGYSIGVIAVTPGTIMPVTIGAGGIGGSGNANGTAGGTSIFSTISAPGGGGGTFNSGAGGAGGVGNSGTGGAGAIGGAVGGTGGAGANGGGAGGVGASGASGTSGAQPGGGGGGGDDEGGSTRDGGNGGAGRIIITYTGPNAGTDQTLAACATSTTLAANTPAGGATGTWTCVSGCVGVTITTPTSPTSTVTGLTPGTNTVLQWTWTGGGAGCVSTNDQVTINTTQGPGCATYCNSTWSNFTDEYISNVTFNGNPYNSTQTSNYTNNTGSCMSVTQGMTYPLSVSWFVGGAFPENVVAFIDWNGDGDFSDVDERQTIGASSTAGTHTSAINITVPCDAVIGNIRMRIILKYAAPAPTTGCESGTFGETEDYCLTIVAATPPVANAGPDQNITCTSSATLDATASVPATGAWTLVSGTGTITNPSSPTSTVTSMSNGANVFQWTAYGTCDSDDATVTINVADLPDVPVNAGNDIFSCTQGLSLEGSDPSPFTGQWVVSSGPNAPTFTPDASANNAQVSGMINGVYVLEWQVNTASCGVLSDQMTINFGSLPAPDAGTDQTICPTGTALNGNDFDGAIGTWSVFSGPAGSGFVDVNDPNTMIYGLVAGSYVLHWSVSGGGCPGGTFDAVTITVNACTNAVTHGTSSNQTFTGCSYTYTDNGGSGGNYANNIAQTWTTFCPDNPDAFATLTVNTANFAPGDYLVIYDDSGPGAPIVAAYFYDASPGGGMVANPPLGATITSSTGCLYVQMNSTAATNTTGWTSTVGCSPTQGVQNQDFVTVNNCGGGGGVTLCSSGSIPAIAGVESNPPDLGGANSGCLGSQEGASNTWVYIVAESDGYIAFQIAPAGGQDFDYAIWGPYPSGYSCPGSTLEDPMRCSWAANGGAGCPSTIGLGIVNTSGASVLPGDVSEGGTCSATNEGWTYPILASAGDVYVLLFQNYGYNNSSFDVTINSDPALIPPGGSYASLGCDPPQALPIELISFAGERKDRVNYIYWSTASEHMNDYFTIEKSKDGITWSVLATVAGAGFSTEMNQYTTLDYNPYEGITYYRLIQTDFDGKKRSYKTIAISTEIEIEDMFSDVFPNPTQNAFYFNYGGKDFESEIIVNVYNSAGLLVISESLLKFNSTQSMQIDTKHLKNGFYQVEIIQNGKREVKKLSIVK